MSKLTKYKFSDLYEMSSGISSSKAQSGHGSPFVSFSTVFNNYFLPEELSDLMNTSIKEQEIYSVKKDDVFITRTSETVDALAMSCVATKDYPKATFSGFVKRLRPKTTGIVYSKYIAFFLRSKYFRKVLDCNTIMTLRASFNEDIFSFLYVYLPDYEEQVRIGDLLYKIEMKVRTNNKINDNLKNYKAKAEYYIREHQENEVIKKLKSNVPLTKKDIKDLEEILWSELGSKKDYESEYGTKPLGEFVREIVGLDMNAAKAAFSEYLESSNLDSRQIYFVNQIVEYIVHNGMMKDLSVLQESPFTDQGSVVEIFTDMSVWMGIRKVIESINENARVA